MLLQQLVSAICFFRLFLSLSPISNTLHSFIFNHLFISFIFDLIWFNLFDFFFQIFNKKSKYKNRTNFQLQQRHIDSTHLLLSLSLSISQSISVHIYKSIEARAHCCHWIEHSKGEKPRAKGWGWESCTCARAFKRSDSFHYPLTASVLLFRA